MIIDETHKHSKGALAYNYLCYPASLPSEIFVHFNALQSQGCDTIGIPVESEIKQD